MSRVLFSSFRVPIYAAVLMTALIAVMLMLAPSGYRGADLGSLLSDMDKVTFFEGEYMARRYVEENGTEAVWANLKDTDLRRRSHRYMAMASLRNGDGRFLPMVEAMAREDIPEQSMAAGILRVYRETAAPGPATQTGRAATAPSSGGSATR